jgi:membrane fusion protein, multidrug efflux system
MSPAPEGLTLKADEPASAKGDAAMAVGSASAAHGDLGGSGVATSYAAGTGRRLGGLVGATAAILSVAFFCMHYVNASRARSLAVETAAAASAPPLVDVATVRPASAQQALVLPADTAAWYQSSIYGRVNGYVEKWYADIGDHVSAGQVLAMIDTPELDAELVAAKAKLETAQAEVNVSSAEAEFARSTYQRWKDAPNGVVSEQERQEKKAGYETAVARLAAARAQVNVDQADVDRLTALEKFKQVTAPYAGTIIQRRIDIGDLVTAGSAGRGSPLYRMAKNDPIRVFVDVPQSAASKLMKVGVPAEISVKDVRDRPFEGRITRTAEAVDPDARTLRVEVDIPNPDGALVPGLYVQASFQLAADGLLQVPASALVFRSGGPQVAVVGADGAVSFRNVTIGRDDGNVVELAKGVAEGEKVVLNISSQIADGDKVQVAGAEAQPGSVISSVR